MKKILKKIGIVILIIVSYIGICSVLGITIGLSIKNTDLGEVIKSMDFRGVKGLVPIILAFVISYIAIYLQIIIHEAGHLVFGLLTGYKFSSFRVGQLLMQKTNGKIRITKHKIQGTGGQCLMNPPELYKEKTPYVLYNLGGAIFNIISVFITVPLFFVIPLNTRTIYVHAFLMILIIIGILFAFMNGLPMKLGVPNDGYNVLSIRKDKGALKSLYYQLYIHGKIINGVPITDIELDKFKLDDDADEVNPLNTNILLMEQAYHLYNLDYDKSREILERLMPVKDKLVTIFRNEVDIEGTFLELMGDCNGEIIEEKFTPNLKKTCTSLKNMIDKQRVLLAYEALYNNNIDEAMKIRANIMKNASKYPFPALVDLELKLVDEVLKTYERRYGDAL